MSERRYYGLDALRGVMMMLGIVLHGANLYLAAPPPAFPFPTDRNHSIVFDLVFHLIHAFRMPTFFVLAGFFAALLVEKRGLAATWKNRAARILAPLLLACVTILPLTLLFMADFVIAARYGAHSVLPERALLARFRAELAAAGFPVGEPTAMHLWFLVYLCYFYVLLPACAWLARACGRWRDATAGFLASPHAVAVFGLWTAMTLWPFRGGQVLEGFVFFRPHLPSLAYYGSFFVLGYLLRGFPEVLVAFARRVGLYAAFSAALFPLALYASHLDNAARGAHAPLHLGAVLANGFCTWSLAALFIGCAMRFFDRDAPWILYASQSSYWVYLVHMPLVMLAGWWMLRYDLPAEVKFLCVAAFTAVLCFVSYHHGVQRTWIGRLLHGRRFDQDWPWRERPAQCGVR